MRFSRRVSSEGRYLPLTRGLGYYVAEGEDGWALASPADGDSRPPSWLEWARRPLQGTCFANKRRPARVFTRSERARPTAASGSDVAARERELLAETRHGGLVPDGLLRR